MFGDAFSPYLIGALSDSFKPLISTGPALDPYGSAVTLRQSTMMDRILTYELTPQEYDREFRALEYSLFSCCFFQVRPLITLSILSIVQFQAMGAFFFFVVSWYVISDKSKAERQIACNADMVGGDEERQQQTAAYREDVDFREGSQPIIRDRGLDT